MKDTTYTEPQPGNSLSCISMQRYQEFRREACNGKPNSGTGNRIRSVLFVRYNEQKRGILKELRIQNRSSDRVSSFKTLKDI
jgi:hypothetical protein